MHLLTLSVSLLPLLSTAQLPPQATFPQRPSTILSIQRTMSYYPLIIDNKSFSDLSLVFTANAIANYSQPLNILTPLSVIESILAASLAPVTTQHLLCMRHLFVGIRSYTPYLTLTTLAQLSG